MAGSGSPPNAGKLPASRTQLDARTEPARLLDRVKNGELDLSAQDAKLFARFLERARGSIHQLPASVTASWSEFDLQFGGPLNVERVAHVLKRSLEAEGLLVDECAARWTQETRRGADGDPDSTTSHCHLQVGARDPEPGAASVGGTSLLDNVRAGRVELTRADQILFDLAFETVRTQIQRVPTNVHASWDEYELGRNLKNLERGASVLNLEQVTVALRTKLHDEGFRVDTLALTASTRTERGADGDPDSHTRVYNLNVALSAV